MADVFISYAREDKARAEQIAQALMSGGLEVFWDSEIPPGQTWADYIQSKLASAKVALVLWSETSTKSQWVREEARMGRDRGNLIPVMIDNCVAPFGFGEVQAADLSKWTGDVNDPAWLRLRNAVSAAANKPHVAPPPAGPASTPPPPPRPHPQQQAFAGGAAAGGTADALSPIDYIQKCFRMFFNGAGRARRAEYWWWVLFQLIVGVIAVVLDLSLFGVNQTTGTPTLIFTLLVSLVLLGPGVSVSARRFHDVGLSGWLVAIGYLLSIIYVGSIFLLVVGLIPGQAGPNKYGPDPKQNVADAF